MKLFFYGGIMKKVFISIIILFGIITGIFANTAPHLNEPFFRQENGRIELRWTRPTATSPWQLIGYRIYRNDIPQNLSNGLTINIPNITEYWDHSSGNNHFPLNTELRYRVAAVYRNLPNPDRHVSSNTRTIRVNANLPRNPSIGFDAE
jgi:hypothetical protein